jgi:hypothetical protein
MDKNIVIHSLFKFEQVYDHNHTNSNKEMSHKYFDRNIDLFDNFSFPEICMLCSKTPETDKYEYDKNFEWDLFIFRGKYMYLNNFYTRNEPSCYRCCGNELPDCDDEIYNDFSHIIDNDSNLNCVTNHKKIIISKSKQQYKRHDKIKKFKIRNTNRKNKLNFNNFVV